MLPSSRLTIYVHICLYTLCFESDQFLFHTNVFFSTTDTNYFEYHIRYFLYYKIYLFVWLLKHRANVSKQMDNETHVNANLKCDCHNIFQANLP